MIFEMQDILLFIKTHAADYSIKLISAIVIFYVGKYLARFVSRIAYKAMARTQMDKTLAEFLKNVLYALLFAMVIIASLNSLGVQTTSFVAMMGAAGLAIGLSLKDQISNFGSGVLIVMLRPFSVGDYVTLAGKTGYVLTIEVFQTILKTTDNLTIYIPNSKIMSGDITNYSLQETRLILVNLNINYSNDIKKVREILMKAMNGNPKVLKNPAPAVGVSELTENYVTIYANSWVNTPDYTSTRAELLEAFKYNLSEANISLPTPSMDVSISNKALA